MSGSVLIMSSNAVIVFCDCCLLHAVFNVCFGRNRVMKAHRICLNAWLHMVKTDLT